MQFSRARPAGDERRNRASDVETLKHPDGSFTTLVSKFADSSRQGEAAIVGGVATTSPSASEHEEAACAEADRRKDEFLAMLAHELRNPLAPIRNALQIMRLTHGDRRGRSRRRRR